MAAITLVASAVTGLLLVVLVLALARGIEWRSNEIFAPKEGGSAVEALASSPLVWVAGFLGLALGALALALAAVGALGLSLPGGLVVALVPFALIVFGYLVVGTYAAVRDRNVSPAGATLAAALVVGTLLLVGIAGRLLMGP